MQLDFHHGLLGCIVGSELLSNTRHERRLSLSITRASRVNTADVPHVQVYQCLRESLDGKHDCLVHLPRLRARLVRPAGAPGTCLAPFLFSESPRPVMLSGSVPHEGRPISPHLLYRVEFTAATLNFRGHPRRFPAVRHPAGPLILTFIPAKYKPPRLAYVKHLTGVATREIVVGECVHIVVPISRECHVYFGPPRRTFLCEKESV
jgi:hypothetical protein